MEEVFDTYIENTFDGDHQETRKFEQFNFNYRPYFPKDTQSKILDIGVGRGEMLTCLKNWKYENFLGIDISPSTINFCKKRDLKCELVENTPDWLLNHKNQFDLITLLDVLEHIPREQCIDFLKALKEGLAPQGKLIIQVPNLQARDACLNHFTDFTHFVGYEEHSLKQVLTIAGFSKIKFSSFEIFPEKTFKNFVKKCFRFLYWKHVRFSRAVTGNMNPEILSPVFFAYVEK